MKKAVLTILADSLFLDQAKQLFSAAYWKAGWKGDYLLLAYETNDDDLSWFKDKGIFIKHCKKLTEGKGTKVTQIIASKFYIFTEYFKQWDHVIYLDVDILIRGSLDGLLQYQGFCACHSVGQTVKDNLRPFKEINPDLLADIKSNFDLNANSFNAGVLSFSTDIIHRSLKEELLAYYEKYLPAARFSDQSIQNLYFNNKWQELPVAYNRAIEKSAYDLVNPDAMDGVIIHTVSLGEGPWDPQNIFYEEWKENFDKADDIDLDNIPEVESLSEQEVLKQSENIARNHIFGEKLSLRNLGRLFRRGFKLVFRDPGRALVKVKQLVGMMKNR